MNSSIDFAGDLPTFAEPDDLTRAIQVAIDELVAEGVIEREAEGPEQPGDHQYTGFCARSVQAYWRFTRDPEFVDMSAYREVTPYARGKGTGGHYWLRVDETGAILDLNVGPHEQPNPKWPNHEGVPRRSFQPDEAGSNVPLRIDARLIMERVRRNASQRT